MKEDGGYIKLFRKFTKWEWYDDMNTSRLFIHLLLTVNWKTGEWHGRKIERGSRITSYRKLSEETGLSVQSVRTSIKRLKSTHEITCSSTHNYIVINIEKYADYQCDDGLANTQSNTVSNILLTQCQHSANTELTTIEEEKERKNIYIDINNSARTREDENIYSLFEQEFKRPISSFELTRISGWVNLYSLDFVVCALREAVIYQKYNFNYIDSILTQWHAKGLSLDEILDGRR